jgi:thioredoxin-like negative regulator of GroEL
LTATTLIAAAQLAVFAWTPSGYETAFEKSTASGRPLLVFVTAEWCGACRQMKSAVMPELERRGILKHVHCAQVDTERESKLAKRLSVTGRLPCLVLFKKTPDGWRRWRLTGMHNADAVTTFLAQHTSESLVQRPDDEESR